MRCVTELSLLWLNVHNMSDLEMPESQNKNSRSGIMLCLSDYVKDKVNNSRPPAGGLWDDLLAGRSQVMWSNVLSATLHFCVAVVVLQVDMYVPI